MSKKESFVCYTEWLQYFDMLKTDAERAEIARAMFQYNIDGTVPCKGTHSTSFMVLFAMMKNQFDRDTEKWEKATQNKIDAGRKGGLARASNAKQCQAEPSNAKQSQANQAVNVNVNDNVNDNVNVNEITTTQHARPTNLEVAEYFGQFLDEEKAGIQAWRWYHYNEQRGWDCLPDWQAAAQRWIEKI